METTSLGAALAAGIGVGLWTAEQAFTDMKHNTGAPGWGGGGRVRCKEVKLPCNAQERGTTPVGTACVRS